ncbi:MAG: DUF6516 family protein [Crocosphaera sp.]|nr:DUF6516 family protein [Crocosphaera sp.]
MLIEDYFKNIQTIIDSFQMIKSQNIVYQKRDKHLGYIKCKIQLIDGSWLYFTEYVEVEYGIDRGKYSYQYMNQNNQLIFRYDNALHHQKLNLSSFPHHKHERKEDNIIGSNTANLSDIFREIKDKFNIEYAFNSMLTFTRGF